MSSKKLELKSKKIKICSERVKSINDSFAGTIPCFLCNAFIFCKSQDAEEMSTHMTSEHNVFLGHDFLLAGCVMNEEERVAIVNVVRDRSPSEETVLPPPCVTDKSRTDADDEMVLDDDIPVSALTPETTLQEKEEKVPKKDNSLNCTECGVSFKLMIQMNRHMRNHKNEQKNKKDPSPSKNTKKNPSPSKNPKKSPSPSKKNKKEPSPSKNTTKDPSPLKNSEKKLEDKANKINSKETPKLKDKLSKLEKVIEIKNTELASSDKKENEVPCPTCGKVFGKRGSMRSHYIDIHEPGEYPCPGCPKVFTSRNKQNSHTSRNCRDKIKSQ